MLKRFTKIFMGLTLLLSLHTMAESNLVALKTDLGTFVIELYPKSAPVTVKNFLDYVDSKFYEGTIFHRVVPGFVVQGGGMTFDFVEKPTADPIPNESINGLPNDYKSVAMARRPDPDSATSQFYINLQNNTGLNATNNKPGYTVFGKVIAGMEVVEQIAQEPRGLFKAFPEAPNYAIRILNTTRVTPAEVQAIVQAQKAPPTSSLKDALVPVNELNN